MHNTLECTGPECPLCRLGRSLQPPRSIVRAFFFVIVLGMLLGVMLGANPAQPVRGFLIVGEIVCFAGFAYTDPTR